MLPTKVYQFKNIDEVRNIFETQISLNRNDGIINSTMFYLSRSSLGARITISSTRENDIESLVGKWYYQSITSTGIMDYVVVDEKNQLNEELMQHYQYMER